MGNPFDDDKWRRGIRRCEKCKFVGVFSYLNVNHGGMRPNDKPQDCPNGCGPLWKVTWKEECLRAEELNEKYFSAIKDFREALGFYEKYVCDDAYYATKALEKHKDI